MTATFQELRPRLFQIAYGMLGSVASAEDVLQEAWMRFEQAAGIENPEAWLRTVVSRLALDELRSARHRRETYPGPWLPEPVPTDQGPEEHVALAEQLSLATMVVLEQLSPAERAAFLLREVFEADYAEVAGLLQKSEPATRQLVRRARQHLAANRPRFAVERADHTALLAQFATAVASGDLAGLKGLLADDVVFVSDGGGKATAATRVLTGPEVVSRLLIGLAAKTPDDVVPRFRELNGQPGVVMHLGDQIYSTVTFSIRAGQITALHAMRNPDKLAHLRPEA